MSDSSGGEVITFYGYKGGVGRTMTLATVAWILASNGRRVLAVDWDLDGPSLHQYFRPLFADGDLSQMDGLLEFFTDCLTRPDFDADRANLLRYAVSLDWAFPSPGTLDFVPAGRQGPQYAARIREFDWAGLLARGGVKLFHAMRDVMRREYDYVLLDSRTGFSDTGGICTTLMPTSLVVCFTLSRANIEASKTIVDSVLSQRWDEPLPVLPVPMRVDLSEKLLLDRARALVRERLGSVLPDALRASDTYWADVEMPYTPFYAYVETLPSAEDDPNQVHSLLAAAERLTAHLTRGAVARMPSLGPEERERLRTVLQQGSEPRSS